MQPEPEPETLVPVISASLEIGQYGRGLAISKPHNLLVVTRLLAPLNPTELLVYAISSEPLRDPEPFTFLRVVCLDNNNSFICGVTLAFSPGPVPKVAVADYSTSSVSVVNVDTGMRDGYVASPSSLRHPKCVAVNSTGTRVAVATDLDFVIIFHGEGQVWARAHLNTGQCPCADFCVFYGMRWVSSDLVLACRTYNCNRRYVCTVRTSDESTAVATTWVHVNKHVRDVEVLGDSDADCGHYLVISDHCVQKVFRGECHALQTVYLTGDEVLFAAAALPHSEGLVVRQGMHVRILATESSLRKANMSTLRIAWMHALYRAFTRCSYRCTLSGMTKLRAACIAAVVRKTHTI